MWPMFTHVHPRVNYEYTKIELEVNLNLTKRIESELKVN